MTSPFSYIRLFLFFLFVGEFNLYAGGYLSSAASHDSTWMVLQGSYRQDIIRVSVTATSGAGSCGVSDLSFVMQNTNNADVLNAKLWYNTTNNYSTATQKSSTINSPSGTITFSSIGVTGISNTTVYFWLSFDISASATQCSNRPAIKLLQLLILQEIE
jgi:hypothetical protein